MSNNTIDVKVDGETVDIEVEKLSPVEVMKWAAKAPDSIKEADGEVTAGPEMVEYMVDLATSQTILTEELLSEIEKNELSRFLGGVIAYAFGEEADLKRTEEKSIEFETDDSFDFGGL